MNVFDQRLYKDVWHTLLHEFGECTPEELLEDIENFKKDYPGVVDCRIECDSCDDSAELNIYGKVLRSEVELQLYDKEFKQSQEYNRKLDLEHFEALKKKLDLP